MANKAPIYLELSVNRLRPLRTDIVLTLAGPATVHVERFECIVEAASTVDVSVWAAGNPTLPVLAPTTTYYLYAYQGTTVGVLAVECSTTAPDAAHQWKTGDVTRAYIGGFSTSGLAVITTVWGIPPAVHAVTHLPGGSDPLLTAAPAAKGVDTAAGEGAALTFARSDHWHQGNTAGSATVFGATGTIGSSTEIAHANHTHTLANLSGAVTTSGSSVTTYAAVVPINKGGTNNTSFTDKGVLYYDSAAGKVTEDYQGFKYDAANNRVGINLGAVAPAAVLHSHASVNYRNVGCSQLQTADAGVAPGLIMEFGAVGANKVGAIGTWSSGMSFWARDGAGDFSGTGSDEHYRLTYAGVSQFRAFGAGLGARTIPIEVGVDIAYRGQYASALYVGTAPAMLQEVSAIGGNDTSCISTWGGLLRFYKMNRAGNWAASDLAMTIDSSLNMTVYGNLFGTEPVRVVSKSSAYGAVILDFVKADANAIGAFTVTLPTAVGQSGKKIRVVKVDAGANVVTLACTGGQTINGAATQALAAQWAGLTVTSDGANWIV